MLETTKKLELGKIVARGKIAVLFYAGWCPDCGRFMPVFDAAAAKAKAKAAKARIDADENPIWEDFKIERVPTVVLFEEGKEKMRVEETGGKIDGKKLEKILGGI
ncbi:MAG: thioredoxin family protein [Candidatus Micrarchaeia archaeon]